MTVVPGENHGFRKHFLLFSTMGFMEIIFIAFGVSMDAFAVSMGTGTTEYTNSRRAKFRLSFHFGFFQFLMPILGWFLGASVAPFIASIDHWIAFLLLLFLGTRMIYSAIHPEIKIIEKNPTTGINLILLSLATSIDAFAVGFSLAMLKIRIWYPSFIIGCTTGTLSLLGIHLGNKLSKKFGCRMEIIGGGILVIIGLRILITHLGLI